MLLEKILQQGVCRSVGNENKPDYEAYSLECREDSQSLFINIDTTDLSTFSDDNVKQKELAQTQKQKMITKLRTELLSLGLKDPDHFIATASHIELMPKSFEFLQQKLQFKDIADPLFIITSLITTDHKTFCECIYNLLVNTKVLKLQNRETTVQTSVNNGKINLQIGRLSQAEEINKLFQYALTIGLSKLCKTRLAINKSQKDNPVILLSSAQNAAVEHCFDVYRRSQKEQEKKIDVANHRPSVSETTSFNKSDLQVPAAVSSTMVKEKKDLSDNIHLKDSNKDNNKFAQPATDKGDEIVRRASVSSSEKQVELIVTDLQTAKQYLDNNLYPSIVSKQLTEDKLIISRIETLFMALLIAKRNDSVEVNSRNVLDDICDLFDYMNQTDNKQKLNNGFCSSFWNYSTWQGVISAVRGIANRTLTSLLNKIQDQDLYQQFSQKYAAKAVFAEHTSNNLVERWLTETTTSGNILERAEDKRRGSVKGLGGK